VDEIAFCRDMVRLRRPVRLRGRWSPLKDGLYRVAMSKKEFGRCETQSGSATHFVSEEGEAGRGKKSTELNSHSTAVRLPFTLSGLAKLGNLGFC